jgi:hypothetical protein
LVHVSLNDNLLVWLTIIILIISYFFSDISLCKKALDLSQEVSIDMFNSGALTMTASISIKWTLEIELTHSFLFNSFQLKVMEQLWIVSNSM